MKNKRCVIGIDFGTTSLSAVLLNIEDFKIEKILSFNTDAYIVLEDDRRKEQSVEKLTQLFDKLISEAMSQPNVQIQAFGFTGQMHGIIGLNKDGLAVTNLVTWQDKSGDIKNSEGVSILEEIRELTGIHTISNGYGIVTLYKWINYDERNDIDSFCTVPDYFGRRLAKVTRSIKISPSMAHSVGLYDAFNDDWQYDLIDRLNLSSISFPQISLHSPIIGYIDTVPVFVAVGDNQSSFMGSVINKDSTILLNVGTGTQLSFLIQKSQYTQYKKHIDGFETQLRPYDTNNYLIATSFLNGGSVYKSLFNFFKDIALQLFGVAEIDEALLWKKMMDVGSLCVNNEKPLEILPLLEGQRQDPTKGAIINNLYTSNFTSGNFVAGFLIGLAKYYKTGLLPELEANIQYICGSGNGLKRNSLFCAIIEDVFGYPLRLTPFDEEAAVGAAVYASSQIGIFNDDEVPIFLEKISI